MYGDESDYHPRLGVCLGNFTNELNVNEFITDFVAVAHKSYSMEITNVVTGLKRYIQKAKGCFVSVYFTF